MISLDFTSTPAAEIECDTLVAYLSTTSPNCDTTRTNTLSYNCPAIVEAARAVDACTKEGNVTVLPGNGTNAKRVALVGVSAHERCVSAHRDDTAIEMSGTGRHRHYSAAATRQISGPHVALAGDYKNEKDLLQACLGALIGSHDTILYGHKKAEKKPSIEKLTVCVPDGINYDKETLSTRVNSLVKSLFFTIDMVNTSPDRLDPPTFAEAIREFCDIPGLEVEIWDEEQLLKQRCFGTYAVGRGSARPPRAVKLTYTPTDSPEGNRHLALVGKGITFDTGGLSLKPADSMTTMKSDMAGAATVVGAVCAAAAAQVNTRITAYLMLAENFPGGTAQRPDDVILMRNGTAVEVTNTDAEGRLVMADGLILATETDADAIIDVATLTGAQIIALGNRVAAVMGSPTVRDEIVSSARHCGEALWPMPLPSYLLDGYRSPVADFQNSGPRPAGMLAAGIFLEQFVADKPWAHLDIAGPAFVDQAWGAFNRSATGMGVLTLAHWLGVDLA